MSRLQHPAECAKDEGTQYLFNDLLNVQVWDSPGDLAHSRHFINGQAPIILGLLLINVWLWASGFSSLSLNFLTYPMGGCENRVKYPRKAHIVGPQQMTLMEESTRCVKRTTEAKEDTKELSVLGENFCCIKFLSQMNIFFKKQIQLKIKVNVTPAKGNN